MTDTLWEKRDSVSEYCDDDINQFLRDIRQYPLLTQEEELELAKKCAQGDAEAIRLMVNSNLRLVVSVAREYAGRGVPLMDLIQEGSIGLLAAARKYDYSKNCRFSTYARKWIKQGVDRGALNHAGLIYVPLHKQEKIRKLMAIRFALAQETGDEPDIKQIAQRSEMPEETVSQLLSMIPQMGSYDSPAGEDGTVLNLLKDLQAPQPYEEMVRRELQRTIERMLNLLPERQRYVLQLRFGMVDGVCYSLERISKMLDVSKERVRQIEQQAITKLKTIGVGFGLEDFLV